MSLRGKRDIDAEAAWIDRLLKRPEVSDETHFLINAWYEDAHVLAWVNHTHTGVTDGADPATCP